MSSPLSFRELGLPQATLATLEQLGYHAMTPIQAASLRQAELTEGER